MPFNPGLENFYSSYSKARGWLVVNERNLNVIRCGEWGIDLGAEGGDKGYEIVVAGTPEEVAEHPTSHTGRYLKQVLAQHPPELVAV